MPVRVVVDSTASLPPGQAAAAGVPVVPLHVRIDQHERPDDGSADFRAELNAALRRGARVSTSRPAPQAFADVYAALAADGASEVVSVHPAEGLSGTIGSARAAAAGSPVPVRVLELPSIATPVGYAALSGAAAAACGASADEVVACIKEVQDRSGLWFYVHTLDNLRRGGRIGAASALLGSALAIKPILTVRDSSIVPLEKVRTSARALSRLQELAVAEIERTDGEVRVAVQHSDAAERAELVAEGLRTRLGSRARVEVFDIGAVIAAHVGAGCVAVTVSPDPAPAAASDPAPLGPGPAPVEPGPAPVGPGPAPGPR